MLDVPARNATREGSRYFTPWAINALTATEGGAVLRLILSGSSTMTPAEVRKRMLPSRPSRIWGPERPIFLGLADEAICGVEEVVR